MSLPVLLRQMHACFFEEDGLFSAIDSLEVRISSYQSEFFLE
ncbi:hypothetical protein AB0759_37300 [Scytonema tolypothrichoides VB-61278_2]|uniref:Uncharacterized protein n=1 Tax=Scytonema tolypothrichoides VB-61278_2 TaxID=3232314 RepID=A0ABW8WYQ8_9CYAN